MEICENCGRELTQEEVQRQIDDEMNDYDGFGAIYCSKGCEKAIVEDQRDEMEEWHNLIKE